MKQDAAVHIQRPRTDERLLWDIISGNIGYRTFLVAYDLKLFPLLAEKPRKLVEVCESLQINCRPAEALLAMSLSIGLVQVKDGYYSLTLFAEDYLLESSPTYLGGFLDILIVNDHLFSFESIKKAVITNSSQVYSGNKLFQTHEEQAVLARAFTYGMHSHSMAAALAWPEVIDLSGYRLLLDIGGGSGAHAIGATLKWPKLQAQIIDLAPVCEVAQEFMRHYGLQDRVKTQVSDMWSQPFPAADLHLYADIYHDWSPEKAHFLTQKSFESLEPGGRIIIHEMLYNNQQIGSSAVVAYNMMMLLCTEGQQYSGTELSTMLIEAGFTDIEIKPTFGYWSIITGYKP